MFLDHFSVQPHQPVPVGRSQPRDLLNVHTTQISNYPSSIVIFNGGGQAAAVEIGIHRSEDGQLLAKWTSPEIEPSGSRSFSMASIQNSALLLPSADDLHYTLRLDSAFDGFTQHFVDNTLADITVNMTDACALTIEYASAVSFLFRIHPVEKGFNGGQGFRFRQCWYVTAIWNVDTSEVR